jgi:hypothetical protein
MSAFANLHSWLNLELMIAQAARQISLLSFVQEGSICWLISMPTHTKEKIPF